MGVGPRFQRRPNDREQEDTNVIMAINPSLQLPCSLFLKEKYKFHHLLDDSGQCLETREIPETGRVPLIVNSL